MARLLTLIGGILPDDFDLQAVTLCGAQLEDTKVAEACETVCCRHR